MRSLTITPHLRLGPALYVLLGIVCAFFGCWRPMWIDARFPPGVDSRMWLAVGFSSPLLAGTAILAVYGYFRLFELQRRSPTALGLLLLCVLALPLIGSVITGVLLAPMAILMLRSILLSVFS